MFGHEGGLVGDAFVGVRDFVFPAYQDAFAFLALKFGVDGNAVFDVVCECCRRGGCAHDTLFHDGLDGEDVGFVFTEGGVDGVGGVFDRKAAYIDKIRIHDTIYCFI